MTDKTHGLPVALVMLLAASSATAAEIDLNANNDAARLTFAWTTNNSELRFDTGWLHSEDRGDVLHLGMHLVDDASTGQNPIRGGLGGKIFYTDSDRLDDDGAALGLGGFLSYTLPRANRIVLSGHAYYAPDVLSFGGSDGYQEIEARVSYNVLREADIYLGARYSRADFGRRGDDTIDNGLHVGIQLRF